MAIVDIVALCRIAAFYGEFSGVEQTVNYGWIFTGGKHRLGNVLS